MRSIKDKPYDRFVKEQLAGDEMAPASPETRIALGFLRLGPRFQTTSALESRQLTLDEMTATVGSVFLGLTMKCAQCHDHKYDPHRAADSGPGIARDSGGRLSLGSRNVQDSWGASDQ